MPNTSGAADLRTPSAFWRQLMLLAAVLSVLLAALASYHKTPWTDEGQFSSASWNLAHHGFLGTTVFDPDVVHLTRIDRRTYWVMPTYLLLQAAWLKVFPATFFSVRLLSVAFLPLVLFLFWRFLTKISTSPRASALAVCLLATNYMFIDVAAFARPEFLCLALGVGGLAAYVEWREEHFHRALLVSNAMIAASGLTHPNGVFHLLGLIAVILYYDRGRINLAAFAISAIPYIVFGACWAAYILQDVPAFVDQMRANGTNDRWTPTLNPVMILWNEIHMRYMLAFGLTTGGMSLLKLPALAAYVTAVAAAVFQSDFRIRPGVRLLLLLAAVYFFGLSVFNQKLTLYLVHIMPWYTALTAFFSDWLWGRFPALRKPLILALLCIISVETGGILFRARSRWQVPAKERAAIAFVRAHSGPQDKIVTAAGLIYDFDFDTRLRDDARVGTTTGYMPDVIVVEPVYREDYDSWKTVRPVELRAINERLASYKLAFDNGVCQVYLRPRAL